MVAERRQLDGDAPATNQVVAPPDSMEAQTTVAKVKWQIDVAVGSAERVSLCELQYCRKNASLVWNTVRLGSPDGTGAD